MRAAAKWRGRVPARKAQESLAMEKRRHLQFEAMQHQTAELLLDVEMNARRLEPAATAKVGGLREQVRQRATLEAWKAVRARNRGIIADAVDKQFDDVRSSIEAQQQATEALAGGGCLGTWALGIGGCLYVAWGEAAMAVRWAAWHACMPCRWACCSAVRAEGSSEARTPRRGRHSGSSKSRTARGGTTSDR